MAPDKNYRDSERRKKQNGHSDLVEQSQLWAHKVRKGELDVDNLKMLAGLGYPTANASLGIPFNNKALAQTLSRYNKVFCMQWAQLACQKVIHLWTQFANVPWGNNSKAEELRIELQPLLSLPNRALDITSTYVSSQQIEILDLIYHLQMSLEKVISITEKSTTHQNLKLWNDAEAALASARAALGLTRICMEPWRRRSALSQGCRNVVALSIITYEECLNALMLKYGWDREYAANQINREIVPTMVPDLLE